jgi:hypothetical protein
VNSKADRALDRDDKINFGDPVISKEAGQIVNV